MNGVLYARYSSDKQTEQSIEGQVRVCKEYCKRNGITLVNMYIDRAVSASKNAECRLQFQQMIKDSDKGKWDCVVVYKLDRFARNRYDSATYKAKLKKNGVRLISATENITDSPEGIILESVLEGMAEFYSKELAQKVTRGMYESATKCNSTGGSIPMGYKVGSDKKLEIDPVYAPVVKESFEMYASGFTMQQICDKLNGQGYRTKQGTPFRKHTFKAMLQNRKYIGVYTYNNEIEIEGGVPAIVDKDTFDIVQERRKKNKKAPARNKAVVEYLLTGKLFCGHCGRPMAGESGSNAKKTYHYYACSGKKRFHDCQKKNIPKDVIEQAVVQHTIQNILDADFIDHIAEVAIKKLDAERAENEMVVALESRLSEIHRSISGLLKAIEQGAVSESITDRLNQLEAQKKDVENQIQKESQRAPELTKEQVVWWLNNFFDGDIESLDYQRNLIDMLVNSVFVYDDPDGTRLIITYNLSQDTQSEVRLSDLPQVCSDLAHSGSPMTTNPNIFYTKHVFGVITMIGHRSTRTRQ